jgi:hypothetical protein
VAHLGGVGRGARVAARVRLDDKGREALVGDGVDLVAEDAEDVEAREDGVGELDVLREGLAGVVPPADGVGGGHHGAAGLEGRDDAGLGDGDALLLHGLVDGGAVLVGHLVELVDAADAAVGEDERAALEHPLARHGVLVDGRGEADGGRALARGVDAAGGGLLDVLEDLGLGRARVAEDEDVDVAADAVLLVDVLLAPAEHGQRHRHLDVPVAVDGGGDGLDDALDHVRRVLDAVDLLAVLGGHVARDGRVGAPLDVVGLDHRPEDGEAVLDVGARLEGVLVDAGDLDLLARPGLRERGKKRVGRVEDG